MAWTVADARAELGITGTGHDALIQSLMDVSLRLVEKYLDRLLEYKRQRMRFTEINRRQVWVPRYPIDVVHSIDDNIYDPVADKDKWEVHHLNGWVKGNFGYSAEIDFTGGYKILPDDLLWALWQVLQYIWDQNQNKGGGVVQTGAIDSITIPDVGTVRFNTSGGGQSSSPGSNDFGGLPINAITVLNLYRRESC